MSKMIQERALLVDLSISGWSGSKTDRDATARLLADAHAQKGAASVSKKLVNPAHLKTISRISESIREAHDRITLPWDNRGMRILPVELHDDYTSAISLLNDTRIGAIETFLGQYEEAREEARGLLGDLYDPADYPTAAELRGRFSCEYRFFPVPDGRHFVADMAEKQKAAIAEDINRSVRARMETATQDLYRRLHEAIQAVAAQVSEDKKRVHGSVFEALDDLLCAAGAMNLTGDDRLNEIIKQAKLALSGVTPEAMRPADKDFDPALKKRVRQDLDHLSAQFAGYFGGEA